MWILLVCDVSGGGVEGVVGEEGGDGLEERGGNRRAAVGTMAGIGETEAFPGA